LWELGWLTEYVLLKRRGILLAREARSRVVDLRMLPDASRGLSVRPRTIPSKQFSGPSPQYIGSETRRLETWKPHGKRVR